MTAKKQGVVLEAFDKDIVALAERLLLTIAKMHGYVESSMRTYQHQESKQGMRVARHLRNVVSDLQTANSVILTNSPATEAAKAKAIKSVFDKIEAMPAALIKAKQYTMEQAVAPEIDGMPNVLLPIFAELQDVYSKLGNHMLCRGHKEFAGKKYFVPETTMLGLGLAFGFVSFAFFASLAKMKEAAQGDLVNEVTSTLVLRQDPKDPESAIAEWVNKDGSVSDTKTHIQIIAPELQAAATTKGTPIAQQFMNARTKYEPNAAPVTAFAFFSGLFAAAFGVGSIVDRQPKCRPNAFQKLDDKMPYGEELYTHLVSRGEDGAVKASVR